MPGIWVGASTAATANAARSIIPALPPSDLAATDGEPCGILVELDTGTHLWPAALERAALEAGAHPIDMRIVAASAQHVEQVLDALTRLGCRRVARIGVFDSGSHVPEEPLWRALADGAHRRGLEVELVGGSPAHFTELNRSMDRLGTEGSLSFSLAPQMHDRERAQLVESLAIQRLIARQAVDLARGRRVHIGPVTLRPRFNRRRDRHHVARRRRCR